VKRHIRLRGINGDVEGLTWEGESLLRAGRLATLEVILDDSSVSRRHAEIRHTPNGWRVRDLGSTNGTFLNGARLGAGEWPLRAHDIIRCGNITLVVDVVRDGRESDAPVGPDNMLVEASCNMSWEEALDAVAFDRNRCPRPGEQLLALLRAGHHLVHLETEEELLHTILNDAVSTLDAQRGAIVLADGPGGPLRLRALATGHSQVGSRTSFSQNLAQRSFTRGESILCCSVEEDPELVGARSIAEGTMASVLCVLLRTPRKRLGVLHLDRGPLQKPFTKDDLHLADALAANVSAGIESASLLRKQRELFFSTITLMAEVIEMRDQYTGGHTQRVTQFALLLAEVLKDDAQMQISAEDLRWIQIGTPLHDIGKVGIDDAILRKPGRLTDGEFAEMKTHTTKGAKILEQVPDLAPAIPMVRSHHERWDGGGYPDGLAGEEISKLARIVAVADAFDAMTSDRPYRPGLPAEKAFAEVEKMKGRQFDPRCAAAFLSIRHRIIQEMQAQTRKLGLPTGAPAQATLRVVT
jgi:HD-GYP domain-containing protein (c-di-GMP phosphodiesterase class II)/pSer/pThr/pTyr-binding forkhead associated (FHA) protein